MLVDAVLDIPVVLPGYDTREPSLRELILHYYQTAGHGICFDRAEEFARQYVDQLHHVEHDCFGISVDG